MTKNTIKPTTTFSKTKKLSKRLLALLELLEPKENLWDICCDHGDLAIEAAKMELAKNVFCVDQVPSVIERLKLRMSKATDIPSAITFKPLCENAMNITTKISNANIIIAGIGENTAIEILNQLEISADCHLILSIHSDNFQLREFLIHKGFKTIKEMVLKDKNKYYEIQKLSLTQGEPTTKVGKNMWESGFPASRELLDKKIFYLKNKLTHGKDEKTAEYLHLLRQIRESLTYVT